MLLTSLEENALNSKLNLLRVPQSTLTVSYGQKERIMKFISVVQPEGLFQLRVQL